MSTYRYASSGRLFRGTPRRDSCCVTGTAFFGREFVEQVIRVPGAVSVSTRGRPNCGPNSCRRRIADLNNQLTSIVYDGEYIWIRVHN